MGSWTEALGGSTEGGRDPLAVTMQLGLGIAAAVVKWHRAHRSESVLDGAAREEALSVRTSCGPPLDRHCGPGLHSYRRQLLVDLGHLGAPSRFDSAVHHRPPCRRRQPPPPSLMNHPLDRAGGFHVLKATNARAIWEEAMAVE